MRFTRAGRVSLAAAGSLAVALLAAACSGSSAGTTSTTAVHLEKTSIVVDALPVVDTAGLYLAIKNGYFRQAGLTVTAKPVMASTLAIPGMEAGTVDLVDANYSSYFLDEVSDPEKYQFKVVVDGNSCDTSTDDVLALPSSGIRSPAQLANKTIAVNVANNIQTLMINASLAANGVNPATVHYKVVPFPLMAAELKAHRVDAIGVVEPFIISAELSIGANPILSECAGPTANFPISGYLATQAWTQKYPNTARAFQAALERGQALADASRAAVEQILPTYIKGLTPEQAAIVNLGQYPTSLNAAHLQRLASLMFTGGLINRNFSVTPLLFH